MRTNTVVLVPGILHETHTLAMVIIHIMKKYRDAYTKRI